VTDCLTDDESDPHGQTGSPSKGPLQERLKLDLNTFSQWRDHLKQLQSGLPV
jgi:hypothetical protein